MSAKLIRPPAPAPSCSAEPSPALTTETLIGVPEAIKPNLLAGLGRLGPWAQFGVVGVLAVLFWRLQASGIEATTRLQEAAITAAKEERNQHYQELKDFRDEQRRQQEATLHGLDSHTRAIDKLATEVRDLVRKLDRP